MINSKTFSGVLGMLFIVMVLFQSAYAEGAAITATGTIKITTPTGEVITIGKGEPIPDILGGSTIEVLTGSINVSPAIGSIRVVVGGSVAVVEAGNKVSASLQAGRANFATISGSVAVTTGNTVSIVKTAQKVSIGVTKGKGEAKGEVSIKSIAGTIEVKVSGVTAEVTQGVEASISIDTVSSSVNIESIGGSIAVTTIEGALVVVAENETIDTEVQPISEIAAPVAISEKEEVVVEEEEVVVIDTEPEPTEPERDEGSSF